MTYRPCLRCDTPMIGVHSHRSRQKCERCGGKALLSAGDFTPEERDEIFAYHAQLRRRHSYPRR